MGPQNMIRTSLSEICYLRAVFDDECFVEKVYNGTTIKCLRPYADVDDDGRPAQVKNNEAFTLWRWIEDGVFAAIEKQYLKSMIFAIYSSADFEERSLLECYAWRIAYPSSSTAQVELLNGENVRQFSATAVRQQATNMIRCLVRMCSTLSPLPDERWVTVKLYYYDHTPDDFQPRHFSDATGEATLKFDGKPLQASLGAMKTPHHSLQLKIATLQDNVELDSVARERLADASLRARESRTAGKGVPRPIPEAAAPQGQGAESKQREEEGASARAGEDPQPEEESETEEAEARSARDADPVAQPRPPSAAEPTSDSSSVPGGDAASATPVSVAEGDMRTAVMRFLAEEGPSTQAAVLSEFRGLTRPILREMFRDLSERRLVTRNSSRRILLTSKGMQSLNATSRGPEGTQRSQAASVEAQRAAGPQPRHDAAPAAGQGQGKADSRAKESLEDVTSAREAQRLMATAIVQLVEGSEKRVGEGWFMRKLEVTRKVALAVMQRLERKGIILPMDEATKGKGREVVRDEDAQALLVQARRTLAMHSLQGGRVARTTGMPTPRGMPPKVPTPHEAVAQQPASRSMGRRRVYGPPPGGRVSADAVGASRKRQRDGATDPFVFTV